MFYDKFIQLCEMRNEKPTPLLNRLNLTSSNIKRWKNGSSVSFDTIRVLADYFSVPISYFFDEDDEKAMDFVKSGNSLKDLYSILISHPDYIASFLNGTDEKLPSFSDYQRISDYMRVDYRYLMTPEHYCELIRLPDEAKSSNSNIPPKDMVLSILGKLPADGSAGDEYKFLQVRISMTILQHLLTMGITPKQLENTTLSKRKIYELGDIGIPEKKKMNYNFSDLCRISEELNISFDCMLSGI